MTTTKRVDRYLVFDAGCSVCTRLAETIQDAVGDKLEAISIHDDQAKALLDRAHPNGWAYAPYVVTVNGDRVRA